MSTQYKAVAAVLQQAITSINAILTSPEDEMHRIRIANRLQMETDQLLLLTGAGDLTTGQPAVLGPATTIGGKKIGKLRKFTEADLVPSDDKVFDLKQQVENAVMYFGPDANAEGILANIPELIIRGMAKKAGLKVTKDEPKELTVEFIEMIKDALSIQNGTKTPDETKGRFSVEALEEIKNAINETKSTPAETILPADEMKAPVSEAENGKVEQPAGEQPKTEEPKQETKPKETDPKKKTGK